MNDDIQPNNESTTVVQRYLTPHEVGRLISAVKGRGRYGLRDGAIVLLSYQHGLRVSEVCALTWDAVNLHEATLAVRRKKNGIAGLHPLTGDALRVLRALKAAAGASPWVFTNERGGPCTPAGIRIMLKRAAQGAGLPRCNPHALRHACGYKLVNDGADIRLVQSYLGHRSIDSTVRYTAVDARRYAKLFR